MEELYERKQIPKLPIDKPEGLTMSEKLDKVLEKFEQMSEKKQFKLPWGIRTSKRKFRKNYAIVQLIRTNGGVTFKMVQIEDNTIKIGENIYDASADNILKYKKYPMLIIPEWNIKPVSPKSEELEIKPFSPRENFKQAVEDGTLTAAEKLILTTMKMEAIKPKMQISGKTILIIIGFLIAGYFVADYFKLF